VETPHSKSTLTLLQRKARGTMSQAKDYYAALGLDKEATESDIKKAYRKLAMTCHPDKNPDDPQAKEKFQAISEAYSVLSDAEKKGKYDRGELDEDGEEFDMNDFMQAAPPPPTPYVLTPVLPLPSLTAPLHLFQAMFGDGFIFQMGGFRLPAPSLSPLFHPCCCPHLGPPQRRQLQRHVRRDGL
jgi:hypothetical protein